MNEHVELPVHDRVHHIVHSSQNPVYHLLVTDAFNLLQELDSRLVVLRLQRHLLRLLEHLRNLVDVVNIAKQYLRVPVVPHILITPFLKSIGLSIQVWSCIINDNPGVVHHM